MRIDSWSTPGAERGGWEGEPAIDESELVRASLALLEPPLPPPPPRDEED